MNFRMAHVTYKTSFNFRQKRIPVPDDTAYGEFVEAYPAGIWFGDIVRDKLRSAVRLQIIQQPFFRLVDR